MRNRWTPQKKLYDYSNTTLPYRIYNYTYLTNQQTNGYWQRYVYGVNQSNSYRRNLLVSANVTDGNGQNAIGLVSNAYDGTPCGLTTSMSTDPSTSATMHDLNIGGNRGNVTSSGTLAGQSCYLYDSTGTVVSSTTPTTPPTMFTNSSATNYSAPTQIQVNSDGGSLTNFGYSPWLGLTSFSGPNGSSGALTYDDYGQPNGATLTTGAGVLLASYPGEYSKYGGPNYLPASSNGYPLASISATATHYTRKTLDGQTPNFRFHRRCNRIPY